MQEEPARSAAPGPSGRPVEVELKFRPATVGAGERYLTAQDVAGFAPATQIRTTQVEDRYVDTARGALAKAGFAARLRASGGRTIVSLKSTAGGDTDSGLHRREEIEGPADRRTGPLEWPPSDARALIVERYGDEPLVEVVTIRQLRRSRDLRSADSVVRLSLDEVDVIARSQIVDRFVELEVELVLGPEESLGRIADVLAADPTLSPSRVSKLDAALSAVRRRTGDRPL